ncbi:MAG TPA: ATP-binding protein [Polyangiaceae bacterium]|nr:ATP-binding protein [Polyangiaceae bacterium]
MSDDTPTLSVALRFRPHADHVANVSRFVADLCRTFIHDDDALSRLQLAVYELMENVVKYTSSGDGQFQLELTRNGSGCVVRLETHNQADQAHRSDLVQRMDALTSAHDPLSHYDAEIAASARRPFGSGLGLVRIRAEGEMIMNYSIEGDQVVVRVEAAFLAGSS